MYTHHDLVRLDVRKVDNPTSVTKQYCNNYCFKIK